MEDLSGIGGLQALNESAESSRSNLGAGKAVAVMSGKGGVGKTTTTINLGAAVADTGQSTVILDMDLDTSNLPIELGYVSAGSTTIQDILSSDMGEDVLSVVNRVRENFGIIPSATSRQDVSWAADDIEGLIDRLDRWVFIDTPPGLGKEQLKLMDAVDSVIVVMTPSESSFIDGMKVVALAEETGTEVAGVIINRVGESRYDLSVNEIRQALDEVTVLGTVPNDDRVKKTKDTNAPLIDTQPNAPAAIAYQRLAARLTGTEYSPPNALKRFMGKVKR